MAIMAVETVICEQAPAAEKAMLAEAAVEKPMLKGTPEPVQDPKKTRTEPQAQEEEEDKHCEKAAVVPSPSFKEESNVVSDLTDREKNALHELKQLLSAALQNNAFSTPPPPLAKPDEPANSPAPPEAEDKAVVAAEDDGAKTVEAIAETVIAVAVEEQSPSSAAADPAPSAPEEVLIWGVPLLADERSDAVLLKFLRARDFKATEAMAMFKNAVLWSKAFDIEGLLGEELGLAELEKVVFMHGVDREGHPVCYNAYGELRDEELYAKAFGDEEKRKRFLRWRIQYLEKGIRGLLDFNPGGVSTMVQVTDLRSSPALGKRELRQATNRALALLQDNYPEFVAKQIFINVPWWYLAFNLMIGPFLTQRTKSKFIFAGPSKSTETLLKYIAPEQLPVQYGGLSKENDDEFTSIDAATEITIKPSSKEVIEIPLTEACLLVWELRVVGWEVSYGAEFTPSMEGGFTVVIQKVKKLKPSDDPIVKDSFKIGEPGKVVLTIENNTSKRKKLLFRSMAKISAESIA